MFGCVVVSSHLRPGIGGMGMGTVRLPACLAGVRWFDADNAVARLMRRPEEKGWTETCCGGGIG